MRFSDLIAAAQDRTGSTLAVALAPTINKLPPEIQRYDDPFLPFGEAVIDATRDLACGYVFHLGAYLALGAAGAVALERTIAYVPVGAIKILHGPFANAEYVAAAFENGFGADAVTFVGSGERDALAYLQAEQHGIFVPAEANDAVLEALMRAHPGQVGIFMPDPLVLTLYAGDRSDSVAAMQIDTYNPLAHSSQASDYRDAIRDATLQRLKIHK
jgi:hypothetical protein